MEELEQAQELAVDTVARMQLIEEASRSTVSDLGDRNASVHLSSHMSLGVNAPAKFAQLYSNLSLARSLARSVAHSVAVSLSRSLVHSLPHSLPKSLRAQRSRLPIRHSLEVTTIWQSLSTLTSHWLTHWLTLWFTLGSTLWSTHWPTLCRTESRSPQRCRTHACQTLATSRQTLHSSQTGE